MLGPPSRFCPRRASGGSLFGWFFCPFSHSFTRVKSLPPTLLSPLNVLLSQSLSFSLSAPSGLSVCLLHSAGLAYNYPGLSLSALLATSVSATRDAQRCPDRLGRRAAPYTLSRRKRPSAGRWRCSPEPGWRSRGRRRRWRWQGMGKEGPMVGTRNGEQVASRWWADAHSSRCKGGSSNARQPAVQRGCR